MRLKVWLDKRKGELFFNDTSMFVWRRDTSGRMQRELEGIIGPATRVIFSEATKKLMRETFSKLAGRYSGLRRSNRNLLAKKMLEELPSYGYGVPELMMMDADHGAARVRVHNCFNALGYSRTTKPVCFRMEGILTGLFEEALGQRVLVRERSCRAMGHGHCDFTVSSYNMPYKMRKEFRRPPKGLEPSVMGFEPGKGEIVHVGINSLLVPRGDAKRLEQESEDIIGPSAKGVWYMISRVSTLESMSRGILGSLRMKVLARLFKRRFLDRLAEIALERGYGILEYRLFDPRRKEIVVRVHNCFNALGAKRSSKPVCYSLSGIISGSADFVFGTTMHCEEVRCRAMGHPWCEFHARPEAQA